MAGFTRKKISKRDGAMEPRLVDEIGAQMAEKLGSSTVLELHLDGKMPLDIICVPPGEDREFYTVFTSGMAARCAATLGEHRSEGAVELLAFLPPSWPVESLGEPGAAYWPISLLENLACGREGGGPLSHGATLPLEPATNPTRFESVLVTHPFLMPPGAAEIELSDGSRVGFYAVVPLFAREALVHKEQGVEPFIDVVLEEDRLTELMVIDPGRGVLF